MAVRATIWAEAAAPIAVLSPAIVALGLASVALALGLAQRAPDPFAPAAVTRPAPVSAPASVPSASIAPAQPRTRTYAIRSILPSRTLNHGDWRWDESAAPASGPVFVHVDTASQTLMVFRGGHAIGVAVIVFGDDRAATPLGAFNVLFRKADHVSSIYRGAPMPYTLRLTQDGVAIHGTPEVAEDLASHGCIGVPIAFARRLFGVVGIGDPVRITHGVFLKPGNVVTLPPPAQPVSDASPRSTRAT